MFAVIFEVQPKRERWDDYLGLAKQLRPKLEATEGFLDNERFKSRRTDGRVLSLSIWRDEKAVVRWRTHGEHHGVQEKGRFEVFEDYHLRVGEITHDSAGGVPAPQRLDDTEIGAAKRVTITELAAPAPADPAARLGLDAKAPGLIDHELFESITTPGKLLLLASWRDDAAADAFAPVGANRHRRVRVIRDYGLFDRREAPQYYADVKR
jgi:heme-degrading monooxygenase HmoA